MLVQRIEEKNGFFRVINPSFFLKSDLFEFIGGMET